MTDRIEQILKTKKLSATQFSEEIGIQRSSLSHILKGRNKPSLDFMLKIKNRYPEINLNWLLLGEGSMIDTDSTIKASSTEDPEQSEPEVSISAESAANNDRRRVAKEEIPQFYETAYSLAEGEIESLIAIYRDGSFKIFRSRK
mgnify:CR=1 FL=1